MPDYFFIYIGHKLILPSTEALAELAKSGLANHNNTQPGFFCPRSFVTLSLVEEVKNAVFFVSFASIPPFMRDGSTKKSNEAAGQSKPYRAQSGITNLPNKVTMNNLHQTHTRLHFSLPSGIFQKIKRSIWHS